MPLVLQVPGQAAGAHRVQRVFEHWLPSQQGVQLASRATGGDESLAAPRRQDKHDGRRTDMAFHAGECSEELAAQASLNGNSRGVLPVNLATALATAGASGGRPGSPMPVGGSALGTMCTAICGISVMRGTTKSLKLLCSTIPS